MDISFNHLSPELIDQVNKFTENVDKVKLKEVEVAGWKELGMEIPMHRELVERWGSPPRKKGYLDLDDLLPLPADVAPLSHPAEVNISPKINISS